MNEHYRAKISVEGEKLIFDINEDMEVYNAQEFARTSVENWLEVHGDSIKTSKVEIRLKGESFTLLN